ncbi:iron uptake transporter permease EfeU [Arthrobacter livingstonensis]|uniref:iron uptake transporter permease EfeU n=1 Tax=Arthrobacter livingstonensis TaxID=670078 RepID=UPI001B86A0A5|nr:iron uptake transporter permease EfeU [Arthrobacter livingstonensis]
MLATLVIGLREGLEAALIVGMIAAFLRRNAVSLKPMWLGVAAAAVLSALVGITLEIVSASLPQAQQEAMETVIGAAAVVIVTFMILWMSKNSRTMKSTLEQHAGSALKGGSVAALAGMAFLAVLREGVETAVFMVAAFQSSLSPLAAGSGAVLGLAIASGIGVVLFRGAIKVNLARFFTATGAFLVFVAAGLVMKSLRTAHEAGWLNIGQDATVSLAWLAPNGSARASILTGVLGIPNDPRLIEVAGWALYLVPMLAFVLWPRSWRPSAARLPRVQFAAAGTLAVAALALAVVAPMTVPAPPSPAGTTPLVTAGGQPSGTVRVTLGGATPALAVTAGDGTKTTYPLTSQGTESHAGRTAGVYTAEPAAAPAADPAKVSATELAGLNGGRMPVGISSQESPGPFQAAWKHKRNITVWLVNGALLDAVNSAGATLTLSGGGLSTTRTIVVAGGGQWQVPGAHVSAAAAELTAHESAAAEIVLWSLYLPVAFAIAALLLALAGRRNRRQLLATAPPP